MDGFDASNGKSLAGIAHLRQSIRDILTTPLGTRVMLRDYGSKLPRLVDAPINQSTIMEIYAATADALAKWEPRFQLTQAKILSAAPGYVIMDLTGKYLPEGKEITLDGIEVR